MATGTSNQLGRQRVSPIILAEDGKNFLSWKTTMHFLLLEEEHAWGVVSGTIEESEAADKEKFKVGNKAAKAILIPAIHPNLLLDQFYGTEDAQSATTIWSALEKAFAKHTGTLGFQSMINYTSFKYDTGLSAEQNISRYKQVLYNLKEQGVTLGEPMKCAKMVDSLPDDWEGLKLAWSSRDTAKQVSSDLYEMIRGESVRRNRNKVDVNQTEALFSKMRVQKSSYRQNRFNRRSGKSKKGNWNNRQTTEMSSSDTVVTCWNCGQKGHTKWKCPSYKPKSKKKSKQKVAANNVEAFLAQRSDGHEEKENEYYVVDSGASHNICFDKQSFVTYEKFTTPREVKLGGSGKLRAVGTGSIRLAVGNDKHTKIFELKEVLHVPRMRRNLISVSKLTDDGYKITCDQSGMQILKDTAVVVADRINDLFMLRVLSNAGETQPDSECLTLNVGKKTRGKLSLRLAHRSLVHIAKERVKAILTREGIEYNDDLDVCEPCLRGKTRRATYKSKPKDSLPRSIGHVTADLCSVSQKSLGGANQFLLITDQFSKFRRVFFLKRKDEAPEFI